VEQRRASLVPKLRAHERARVVHMPDFSPPSTAATTEPEHQPLYLPSGLLGKERTRVCPLPVAHAEGDLRRSSMATAFEDLLRYLVTHTFLHRHRVQNLTGVRANTRARDGIGGVSRRVDGSAAAYRRHRMAYKKLVGPDPDGWEDSFKPLTANDVRGLSEKAISDDEIDARYRATRLAKALANVNRIRSTKQEQPPLVGGSRSALGVEDEAGDEEAGLVPIDMGEPGDLADALAPGEGTRKVSWIWMAGLQVHNGNDTHLTDCMYMFWLWLGQY
jgi:hypothetical protein